MLFTVMFYYISDWCPFHFIIFITKLQPSCSTSLITLNYRRTKYEKLFSRIKFFANFLGNTLKHLHTKTLPYLFFVLNPFHGSDVMLCVIYIREGSTGEVNCSFVLRFHVSSLADPGAPPPSSTTGLNSYIFAYLSAETCPRRTSTHSLTWLPPTPLPAPPQREILDPPLLFDNNCFCNYK